MNDVRCSQCGLVGLQPGFVDDEGAHPGHAQWIAGQLEFGFFGGAKKMGQPRWRIDAFRCPSCTHLELFAPQLSQGWQGS